MAEIGRVLNGRYRLVELLGEGGMATIYRARDAQLDRDVAVKILRPEYGADPGFAVRFRQEAQSAASLSHPNVVSVFDYGQDEAGPYIVMELVEGEDLASLLRRTGPLPPRQAARIAAEVARALAAAHARGIVHRDVKPGNILISGDGRVRVADFGIARALAEARLTLPGTTLGSVHYLSPEQARGESATAPSDVYSLGIVLYEMLTGRRPYEGDSAAAIAVARLSSAPQLISSIRAGVPPVLEAIDRKAMALDPAARFSSATVMAEALEAFLADRAAAPFGAPDIGRAAVPRSAATGLGAEAARSAAGGPPVPYPPDAYASGSAGAPAAPSAGSRRPIGAGRKAAEFDRDAGRPSPWPWVAGILGLVILAGTGFFAYRALIGGTASTPAPSVEVPSFIGALFGDAQKTALDRGLEVYVKTSVQEPGKADGTVVDQDTQAGTQVDRGARIGLTVVSAGELVEVPDLKNKTQVQAVSDIIAAGLEPGAVTDAYDPVVAEGSVVDQAPLAGEMVPKGSSVNYVVSKGRAPTPSPTLSPFITEPPTPTPEPSLLPVNDYMCLDIGSAVDALSNDGFQLGRLEPDGYGQDWQVVEQDPLPGSEAPRLSDINVRLAAPGNGVCPVPEPTP